MTIKKILPSDKKLNIVRSRKLQVTSIHRPMRQIKVIVILYRDQYLLILRYLNMRLNPKMKDMKSTTTYDKQQVNEAGYLEAAKYSTSAAISSPLGVAAWQWCRAGRVPVTMGGAEGPELVRTSHGRGVAVWTTIISVTTALGGCVGGHLHLGWSLPIFGWIQWT